MTAVRIREVEFAGAIGRPGQAPPADLRQVAIAGKSNVGKSSLVNAVVGRKRIARVSGTPGKTREINFYLINDRFFLVDLPGYGFARAPEAVRDAWRRLVEDYLTHNDRLDGLVLLIDCRRGIQEADRQLLDYLSADEIPVLVVLTKMDKLNRSGRSKAVADLRKELEIPADQVLATSAQTGEGVDVLVESLLSLVDSNAEGNP
ncbi:MAG: YihA family ribosome biogenesis GTP-binding protein [Gemmatimonadetes bacterium]|nr:YihA family ribosome biogenesis GTP-binding protein [Gemmatimonadota bacterium]